MTFFKRSSDEGTPEPDSELTEAAPSEETESISMNQGVEEVPADEDLLPDDDPVWATLESLDEVPALQIADDGLGFADQERAPALSADLFDGTALPDLDLPALPAADGEPLLVEDVSDATPVPLDAIEALDNDGDAILHSEEAAGLAQVEAEKQIVRDIAEPETAAGTPALTESARADEPLSSEASPGADTQPEESPMAQAAEAATAEPESEAGPARESASSAPTITLDAAAEAAAPVIADLPAEAPADQPTEHAPISYEAPDVPAAVAAFPAPETNARSFADTQPAPESVPTAELRETAPADTAVEDAESAPRPPVPEAGLAGLIPHETEDMPRPVFSEQPALYRPDSEPRPAARPDDEALAPLQYENFASGSTYGLADREEKEPRRSWAARDWMALAALLLAAFCALWISGVIPWATISSKQLTDGAVTGSKIQLSTISKSNLNFQVERGPRGETGPTGARGPQGIQGVQGPAGKNGKGINALNVKYATATTTSSNQPQQEQVNCPAGMKVYGGGASITSGGEVISSNIQGNGWTAAAIPLPKNKTPFTLTVTASCVKVLLSK